MPTGTTVPARYRPAWYTDAVFDGHSHTSVKPTRLLLFAAIMLAQFFLFEAGLRLAGGSEAAPVFQQLFLQDPIVGYRLKPGASARFRTADFDTEILINSSGTRDREIGPKAADEHRIVVLGDSLVLAVQVQQGETFTAVLEKRLNAHRVPGEAHYRVINAGIQGYGPVEELTFFEHVASRFEADVVLVGVFVGNDAMEANDTGARILPVAEGTVASGASAASAASEAVKRPSRYPLWLRRLTRRSMVLQITRMRATTLLERFGQVRPIDRALTMYLPELPPEMARGLEVSRECVRRIAAIASDARRTNRDRPAAGPVPGERRRLREPARDCRRSGGTLLRDAGTARFQEALAPLGLPTMDAASGVPRPAPAARALLRDDGPPHRQGPRGAGRGSRGLPAIIGPAAVVLARHRCGRANADTRCRRNAAYLISPG